MKKLVLALAIMMGYSSNGSACSMRMIYTGYERQANNIVYMNDQGVDPHTKKLIGVLKGIDALKFHPVGELKQQQFFMWDDSGYFSDGKHIVWRGEILVNGKGLPAIDVKSFRQSSIDSDFAADKYSIYFKGQRVEDNTGTKKVDLTTLKVLDDYMMGDATNLYHNGKYRGKAKGYQVIRKAQYGSPGVSCFVGDYIIAKNAQYVFIDGEIIEGADPQTFTIKRWMPEILIDYEDKTDAHTYTYGKTEAELDKVLKERNEHLSEKGIFLLRDKVVYVRRSTPYGEPINKDSIVEIKGLDPDKVQFINSRTITQDNRTLYILEGAYYDNDNKDAILRVIHLEDNAIDFRLHDNKNVINDKNIVYIITDKGKFAAFNKVGTWVRLGSYFNYFARDDKYVYIFDTAQRFKTANPQKVSLDTDYELVTTEGVYDTKGNLRPQ